MADEYPVIETTDGMLDFEPRTITRLGGRMAWDVQQDRTLTNELLVDNKGQQPVRFVIEGMCIHDDLLDLLMIAQSYNTIRYVGEKFSFTTTFDELRFDRRAEESHLSVDNQFSDERQSTPNYRAPEDTDDSGSSSRISTPNYVPSPPDEGGVGEGYEDKAALYSFQLQQKQNQNDDNFGPNIQ